MVFEKLTDENIEEMCDWMEFYDLNGYFPWQKKKMMFTISGEAIEILNTKKNKSNFINELILNN